MPAVCRSLKNTAIDRSLMTSVAAAVSAALAAAKAEKGIIVDQMALGLITTAFAAPRLYHAAMRTGMEPIAVNIPPSWPCRARPS